MADLTLSGDVDKPRGMLVPILAALVVLAALGWWFSHTYLHTGTTGAVDHVGLYPVHVKYARGTGILVGEDQSEDALYLIANVALTDKSEVPLFIKSIHGSMTTEDGSVMEANVIDKNDLPRIMQMFPALKPLVDATGAQPLTRESQVPAGATGNGYVIMSWNVPQTVWDKRRAADVSVDFYHQDTITLPVPK